MNLIDWARSEVKLACKEKVKTFGGYYYGRACCESALKALNSYRNQIRTCFSVSSRIRKT